MFASGERTRDAARERNRESGMVRITRSRMAGDPPDAVVAPRLAHLSLMDFHRGREAIEPGRRAVASALPVLRDVGLG